MSKASEKEQCTAFRYLIGQDGRDIYNGNCTLCQAIWSEIKHMITKSHDRIVGVRFVITSLIKVPNEASSTWEPNLISFSILGNKLIKIEKLGMQKV